ncbi:TetR/AcrR family transcriptional regulator [Methylobrevis albus]|uniref:TetR/AcrR family transcriptional regulator n=1 Tax=Methylobrevis albus TaxID=2793297 RepID=A0A931MWY6_9HYPH|nr:TetR/AcrR family transcriptional regulator [Methylobrevis albus]MBH0236227.1 TetR/AcrR family transcriptional regulator [Methylobrevis albus]
MTVSKTSFRTRWRLLDAALDVFAAKGFEFGSIKEICQRAAANVAAVNYHYRSKELLYEAVIGYAFDECYEAEKLVLADAGAPARQRLEALLAALVVPSAGEIAGAKVLARLLAWEVVRPSGHLARLVADREPPFLGAARAVVGAYGVPAAEADLAARWLVAQGLAFRPGLLPIAPGGAIPAETLVAVLADLAEAGLAAHARRPAAAGLRAAE